MNWSRRKGSAGSPKISLKESSPCDSTSTCVNTPGSYRCDCNEGFIKNVTDVSSRESNCININECAADYDGINDCGPNTDCFDSSPGHTCRCKSGYTGIPTDKYYGCQNIDECSNGSNDCHEKATCTDLTPGYKCKCNPGYTGDGVTCEDVDECSVLYGENACDKGANSECKNLDGSYKCICKEGYIPTSYD